MNVKKEEVKRTFQFDIPKRHSSWQQLRLKDVEASPSTFKLIDETGIVLALQADMIKGLARKVARQQPTVLQKVFQVDQTFQVPTSSENNVVKYQMGFGPRSKNEASLCIIQPQRMIKQRSEIETLCEMS